jgi:hypothetical protein
MRGADVARVARCPPHAPATMIAAGKLVDREASLRTRTEILATG